MPGPKEGPPGRAGGFFETIMPKEPPDPPDSHDPPDIQKPGGPDEKPGRGKGHGHGHGDAEGTER